MHGVKVVLNLVTHIHTCMCAHAHSMDRGKSSSLMPGPTQLLCLPRELHRPATAHLGFPLGGLLLPAVLFLLSLGDECALAFNSAQYLRLRHALAPSTVLRSQCFYVSCHSPPLSFEFIVPCTSSNIPREAKAQTLPWVSPGEPTVEGCREKSTNIRAPP